MNSFLLKNIDVDRNISFPGVIGFAVNKQILSTGVINGGLKGQFNFGKLRGEKNDQSFENKYKEGCINFQVIAGRSCSVIAYGIIVKAYGSIQVKEATAYPFY